ncbi:hypothetical protein EVG20_g8509, partial [Dentipellis fragilis]
HPPSHAANLPLPKYNATSALSRVSLLTLSHPWTPGSDKGIAWVVSPKDVLATASALSAVEAKVFRHEFITIFRFSHPAVVHPNDFRILELIDEQNLLHEEENETTLCPAPQSPPSSPPSHTPTPASARTASPALWPPARPVFGSETTVVAVITVGTHGRTDSHGACRTRTWTQTRSQLYIIWDIGILLRERAHGLAGGDRHGTGVGSVGPAAGTGFELRWRRLPNADGDIDAQPSALQSPASHHDPSLSVRAPPASPTRKCTCLVSADRLPANLGASITDRARLACLWILI